MEDQKEMLAQRPTINEITATYERMQSELRQRLITEIGIAGWIKDSELSSSGCSDYPNIGGESRRLGNWYSKGSIPDARWSQAVAIVTEVTGRYGFGPPEMIVDRPGNHTMIGTGQYGATYELGTAVNTVLGVNTGCHRNPPDSPSR